MPGRTYDLEERLLAYTAAIVGLVETMPNTRAANHVGGQLLRSGTAPLFNHGEAQAAESPKDFVHKMRICLKELRESYRALRLMEKARLTDGAEDIGALLRETDELIRIFVASIRTAQGNKVRESTEEGYEGNFDVRCWPCRGNVETRFRAKDPAKAWDPFVMTEVRQSAALQGPCE